MNGFANAILTLLLGWLRSLFTVLWALISDGGGSLFTLLRNNWQIVFIVLCVGGFMIDRIIYFIRWRPYYLWGSKRRLRKMRAQQRQDAAGDVPPPGYGQPEGDEAYYDQPGAGGTLRYQPAGTPGFAPVYHPRGDAAATVRYAPGATRTYEAPSPYAYQEAVPMPEAYAPYPPEANFAPAAAYDAAPYRAPVAAEPLANEPRFDEDPGPWAGQQSGFQELAAQSAPEPEGDRYLKDVQSGFAPPPAPEALYAPRGESAGNGQVHPGLDPETFQQNIGLGGADARPGDRRAEREPYENFTPFSAAQQPGDSGGGPKPRVLETLAKKARTFVNGEDESNPPTIRDLQPTVDVTNAFHAPVYPIKKPESEEK